MKAQRFPWKFVMFTVLLAGALALAACGGQAPAPAQEPADQATPLPPVIASEGVVVDGRLVPADTVEISFNTTGEVAEVLVEEGDVVEAGQVIARLGNRAPLESSLSNAKMELLAAEQELLSAQQDRQTLDDELPERQTAALEALTEARDGLRDAERQYKSLSTPANEGDINEARANLILAREMLERAQDDYDPYKNKSGNNLTRAALLNKLATAQQNFEAAQRKLNSVTGVFSNEFDTSQKEAELKIAQATLDQAQSDYDLLMQGPDPQEVALAESRIAAAEGRIEAAKSSITAAEAALADLDLIATINGTVVNLDLVTGQRVSPGTPAAQLADFSQWYVETDNLTEIEVVEIELGQEALIYPDALPDLELSGTVERISDLFEEKRGDITYTARVKLTEPDPRLRWGMTVLVRFQ